MVNLKFLTRALRSREELLSALYASLASCLSLICVPTPINMRAIHMQDGKIYLWMTSGDFQLSASLCVCSRETNQPKRASEKWVQK